MPTNFLPAIRSLNPVSVACFGLVSLSLAVFPDPARAVVVTVNGISYDVTTVMGTLGVNYPSPDSFLPTLEAQPWYTGTSGDNALAIAFAEKVDNLLDLPNDFFGPAGPYFAFNYSPFLPPELPFVDPFQRIELAVYNPDLLGNPPAVYSGSISTASPDTNPFGLGPYTYAVARQVQVPGPLPIFGVAAGLAWSRRLRSRIRNAPVCPTRHRL